MASQATGARQDVLVSDLDVPKPAVDKIDSLTVSTTGSSASAAFARSLFLFLGASLLYGGLAHDVTTDEVGIMFRRPSKLFRPSRGESIGRLSRRYYCQTLIIPLVDTWGGLRQLALSADQTLSATFIRDLLRRKSGVGDLYIQHGDGA